MLILTLLSRGYVDCDGFTHAPSLILLVFGRSLLVLLHVHYQVGRQKTSPPRPHYSTENPSHVFTMPLSPIPAVSAASNKFSTRYSWDRKSHMTKMFPSCFSPACFSPRPYAATSLACRHLEWATPDPTPTTQTGDSSQGGSTG